VHHCMSSMWTTCSAQPPLPAETGVEPAQGNISGPAGCDPLLPGHTALTRAMLQVVVIKMADTEPEQLCSDVISSTAAALRSAG
jgi:hypothetical protein